MNLPNSPTRVVLPESVTRHLEEGRRHILVDDENVRPGCRLAVLPLQERLPDDETNRRPLFVGPDNRDYFLPPTSDGVLILRSGRGGLFPLPDETIDLPALALLLIDWKADLDFTEDDDDEENPLLLMVEGWSRGHASDAEAIAEWLESGPTIPEPQRFTLW